MRGRFLLLIVGDGIRESVEDMVEYLTQTPQLYFTLALVELQVFKLNATDNSLIVIPQFVTRTREITRAIVRIEGNTSADFKVNIEEDILTVSAEKTNEVNEESEKQIRKEYNFRSFKRSFTLDDKIDATNIEASYVNGVLRLNLPKKEAVKQSATEIERK